MLKVRLTVKKPNIVVLFAIIFMTTIFVLLHRPATSYALVPASCGTGTLDQQSGCTALQNDCAANPNPGTPVRA